MVNICCIIFLNGRIKLSLSIILNIMNNLTIVRGDLTDKPIASENIAKYFENYKDSYEGVLYIGYPIIGTSKGSYQIDGVLLTKQHGLVVISLSEENNEEISKKLS